MRLEQLLQVLPDAQVLGDPAGIEILRLADDSRETVPGCLFVAVQGERADGHDYIEEALARGAVAVILERERKTGSAVAIKVRDSTEALAAVAARFFDDPSRGMTLIGITGTNGKTTTSLLVQRILREAGHQPGLIGTLRYEVGGEVSTALNTTPGSLQLQRLLHRMRLAGNDTCVMEVSSHGLALGRVRGCRFDIRVFMNLTRDHLDFHTTMEAYFAAKKHLFEAPFAKEGTVSIVNIDDPWSRRLVEGCAGPVRTFGIRNEADLRASDVVNSIEGLSFSVRAEGDTVPIVSPLSGTHNVENILAALSVGSALGVPLAAQARALADVASVPGRFEKIPGPGFSVIVDYAHTDDALRNLLESAREVCQQRLITIFGCGGDRDRGKRPLMGGVATKLSDVVIVTSDNPRTEAPGKIIEEILAGVDPSKRNHVQFTEDRREAIRAGITQARAGDLVVVAGKGHEDYQILGETRIHFDDREEVRKFLGLQPSVS